MPTTPNMGFPMTQDSVLSKDITHNMAVRMTDWQCCGTRVAINFTNTPPSDPADGDTYLLNTAPTGVWSGHGTQIAYFQNGAYVYREPTVGEFFYDQTANAYKTFNGTTWTAGPT